MVHSIRAWCAGVSFFWSLLLIYDQHARYGNTARAFMYSTILVVALLKYTYITSVHESILKTWVVGKIVAFAKQRRSKKVLMLFYSQRKYRYLFLITGNNSILLIVQRSSAWKELYWVIIQILLIYFCFVLY